MARKSLLLPALSLLSYLWGLAGPSAAQSRAALLKMIPLPAPVQETRLTEATQGEIWLDSRAPFESGLAGYEAHEATRPRPLETPMHPALPPPSGGYLRRVRSARRPWERSVGGCC